MHLFDMTPVGALTQEQVQEIISPIQSELCQCWHDGWHDWMNEVSELGRSKLLKRSRANNVNDFAVHSAATRFANRTDVTPDRALGFFKLYVGGAQIVLRFKRLSPDHLAKNVRTAQQRAYYRNEYIPGIYPGAMRLTVGYVLDAIEGDIHDILITSQLGQKYLLWSFSIMEEAHTMAFPSSTAAPVESSVQFQPNMPAVAAEAT